MEQSKVHVLNESVARKIAAGEVIDRPYAAVRELLDNAIDAGASEVSLSLAGGGIDEIKVSDDGVGMDEADLEICWLPHATSKISSVEDLEEVSTLGFRGEALSSLAACSRLEIIANREDTARRLSVHGGKLVELGLHRGAPGTTVSASDLFYNMPARRRFLKSARAESGLCRKIFLEKAAAHPDRVFRLFSDGEMKLFLPAGTAAQRVEAAWPRIAPKGSLWESAIHGPGFSLLVVHGRPELSRRDRKYIQIYANRRRIDEFGLVQAVQHAYDPWMPGGAFPIAFVFIEVDPSLVDFNIHPAKKEARFRDMPALRQKLIEVLKDRITSEAYRRRSEKDNARSGIESDSALFTGNETPLSAPENAGLSDNRSFSKEGHRQTWGSAPQKRRYNTGLPYSTNHSHRLPEAAAETFVDEASKLRRENSGSSRLERFNPIPRGKDTEFRYLGQAMGVFLIAESGGSLFMVDQHAAHERVLYEDYLAAPPNAEQLLIPRPLDLDKKALMRLELRKEKLAALGIETRKNEEGGWELTALPAVAKGMESEIAEFLESGAGEADGLEKALWADLSCKAAVKDNSILDDQAATTLLQRTFALETPRCPHGRPLWFEVSRDELFQLVGRTV